MSAIGEDDQLIFLQKFCSDDYLSIYASDEKNVVGWIHPTQDISDIPQVDISDNYVVDMSHAGTEHAVIYILC